MASPSPIELEVQRIRVLVQERQFPQALEAAGALLITVPENRDALYLRALGLRMVGDLPAALATLEAMEALHPRFSRLYQERGQCWVGLKQAPAAIDAFLHAVRINPALPISWTMLEGLYRLTQQADGASAAAAHAAALKQLPTQVVTATALFYDGDLLEAEELIRAFLLKHGHHVEAMRLLARIGIERDVLDDAQLLIEGVLDVAPDYHAARCDYVQILLKRHLHEPAQRQIDLLLQADPQDRNYRTLQALAWVGLGQHERAIRLYQELLPGAAQPAELHLSIAHSLKTLGHQPQAIAEYRTAAASRPGYGDAWWSLANLKTYRFDDAQIKEMRALEAAATAIPDRYHLCFALGKALEDRHEYAASWEYYTRGNALKRTSSAYRPEIIEREAQRQMEVCTADLFARHRESGAPAPDPIFIVGLPRSGSTLLEQILASHSLVEGTQELADIPRIAAQLNGRETSPAYPGVLATLSDEELRRLGEQYLANTRSYRSGRPYFIDKMPNNFRHIGLIQLILPNAKIIDARREPMACCVSNFKQLFAQGQEFTYGLEDVARYYRNYLTLMGHWDAVLPGKVLRVLHEEVVEDLAGSVRRLLDFCGLGFESACIDFHKTERSVRTASSEQVRQPIFRDGLEQWRNFEPWLEALRFALHH